MIKKLINQIKDYNEIAQISPNEYLIEPKPTMRATTYTHIQETPNITINILGLDNFNNPRKYIITDNTTKIDHIIQENTYNTKKFNKLCEDITEIFTKNNAPTPHIYPETTEKTINIEIGEDTFHDNPFPIKSNIITELDNYMSMNSEIYITNNSLGDAFFPNIIISYRSMNI